MKIKAGTLFITSLLLCFAGCGESKLTTPPSRDSGLYLEVVDANGNPVEGIKVHLVALPNQGAADAFVEIQASDCNGEEN